MKDPTIEFFRTLSRRGSAPMLGNVTATVRFDITGDSQTSSWRLAVDKGRLAVSPRADAAVTGDDADCVITADKARFDGIAGGGVNAMAALLRGEIAVSGDPELLVAVQRLFPDPPRILDTAAVDADPRRRAARTTGGAGHGR
jgi:hypothetical protein